MKFLRNLLAAILGCMIAFGIIFVMFLIIASLASVDEGVVVKKKSVLDFQVEYPVMDYTGNIDEDPFALFAERTQGLDEILHAIEVAKEDKDIKGISIRSIPMLAGISQTRAIREALQDFKESGKFVYAYGDFYLQKDYYLASVADSIFLNPMGAMDFKGLAAEILYFKELQEKTGVKMEVVRHGKYKNAVEPYLDDEMSQENREQISELIESIWATMIGEISSSRGITLADLETIADTLGGRSAEYALKSGLVDQLAYYDTYEALLKKASATSEEDKQNFIGLRDYTRKSNKKKLRSGTDRIAIIFAQGEILYGEGAQDWIGQGLITRAIRKARDDEKTKAIVLRVNSPGGNALTSDIIWREIELAKAKKPMVVSMGDVAASGGYYIAVGADKIFAEPTTITGSIGVFGTIPNISALAGNIGVNAEQVGTNENAVDYSFFEPMTEKFRDVIEEGIEHVYDTFLQRVADGRQMSLQRADSLAQGRVWSGEDAQQLGLVDSLGGLEAAVAAAADLAGIESYSIRKYPRYKTGLEQFLEDVGGAEAKKVESQLAEELGPELYGVLKELRYAARQRGIQARMPYTLNIK